MKMRSFFISLSILTCILGLIFIVRGWTHPTKYQMELSKETTTAVRVTQIYSEATHRVVVGIGFVSLGILVASIGRLIDNEDVRHIFKKVFGKNRDHPEEIQDE